MHKVAVVTRTLARPLLLERALNSVSAQTMKNFVWVIVNDGGEASAVDRLAGRARQSGIEVSVIHNAKSNGMEAASNAGVRGSVSNYVVIHDDDDSWAPEFLSATTAFLDTAGDYAGAVTHVSRITERITGSRIATIRREPHKPVIQAVQLADMARSNLFPPIAFTYRRSLYDKLGGYDETMAILGDWDFNLRILLCGDVGVIPRALANYHVRSGEPLQDGAYANSITPGHARQLIADAAYRNRWLRADIEAGRFGLGNLLAIGRLPKPPGQSASALARAASWWSGLRGRIYKGGRKDYRNP